VSQRACRQDELKAVSRQSESNSDSDYAVYNSRFFMSHILTSASRPRVNRVCHPTSSLSPLWMVSEEGAGRGEVAWYVRRLRSVDSLKVVLPAR
jgi:hypothetical protein